jgi:tetratricopeptide (TPR) repeat protein
VIARINGRLLDAEDFLKRAASLDPRGGSHGDLGALYSRLGRYEEAEKVLRKGCRLTRYDTQIRVELGNVFLQTDRPKEALAMFREAAAIDPAGEEAARGVAAALMALGEPMEAGRTLRAAAARQEGNRGWRLQVSLCRLLTDLADKTNDTDLYEEAASEVRRAIQQKPDEADPYFYSGIVFFKQENYHRALKQFRHALALDPDHFDAEQNIHKLERLTRSEALARSGHAIGVGITLISLAGLVFLWWKYLNEAGKNGDRLITSTMVMTLSPILLGFITIGFLLPWLIKLKLPGLEAELSQPRERVLARTTGNISVGGSFAARP